MKQVGSGLINARIRYQISHTGGMQKFRHTTVTVGVMGDRWSHRTVRRYDVRRRIRNALAIS